MFKASLYLLILAFVVGCSTVAVSPEEAREANYGPYPGDYKRVIEEWFALRLKDAESARYRYISEPEKAYSRAAPVAGGGVVNYGYIVKVLVNAKNSYGGYTGWEEYRLLIKNGTVVDRITRNMYFDEPWYQ